MKLTKSKIGIKQAIFNNFRYNFQDVFTGKKYRIYDCSFRDDRIEYYLNKFHKFQLLTLSIN
jgi:hypothetical protein